MDVASLAAAAGLESSRTRAQSTADPIAQVFQKADQHLQKQRDVVSVELSSFGKLKSSFSETQVAARALSDTKQTGTDAGVTKAVNNFVKAFNSAARTVRSATAPKSALADNSSALAAGSDLLRTVSADSIARSDLKKIGITQQNDGALAINAQQFEAALKANPEALRSTLSGIGQQVDRTATRELANNGNVGRSVNSLDNRARSLESQQANQQALAVSSQQTISTQTANLNKGLNNLNTGAAAYERMFSL